MGAGRTGAARDYGWRVGFLCTIEFSSPPRSSFTTQNQYRANRTAKPLRWQVCPICFVIHYISMVLAASRFNVFTTHYNAGQWEGGISDSMFSRRTTTQDNGRDFRPQCFHDALQRRTMAFPCLPIESLSRCPIDK